MLTKGKSSQGLDAAEAVALEVLAWLTADEDRLYPFLNASGLTPDNLRSSLSESGFLAGVLDHVMGDENVLVACARALDMPPERIAAAWRRLGPPEPEDF